MWSGPSESRRGRRDGGEVIMWGPGHPNQGAGAGTRPERRGRDVVRAVRVRARAQGPGLHGGDVIMWWSGPSESGRGRKDPACTEGT